MAPASASAPPRVVAHQGAEIGPEPARRGTLAGGPLRPPAGFDAHPARKLRLEFDDIERPSPTCRWYVPCSWRDVERLVAFAAGVKARRWSPQAWPNRRILWMGDELLELDGALIAADRRWRPHLQDEPEVPARR